MPSLLPGFEYDIFISYRQNDNRSGWVTEFVRHLNEELAASLKEPVSVYMDSNPHDGLAQTHDVDESLKHKLKCLVFIPIISQTYCDPKCFAWKHEFLAFKELAPKDTVGLKVRLANGNVASRILPVRIHELDQKDTQTLESELGHIRGVDFIYRSQGITRPLTANEVDAKANLERTYFGDQVIKVVKAIKEIITAIQDPAASRDATSEAPFVRPVARRKIAIASGAVLLVALAAFVIVHFTGIGKDALRERDRSIAVLPFENMNKDSTQDYFSNGMSEDIVNQLGKISDLRVKPRASTVQYKDTQKRMTEIGEELNVANIVAGSVRRVDDKVRIVVQLIDAQHDVQVWSETYNRDFKDVLSLQSEIAIEIARALKATLTQGEKDNINQEVAANVTAYDYFLKARESANRFGGRKEELEEAMSFVNEAIRLDPTLARAVALKGRLWLRKAFFGANEKTWTDSALYFATKSIEMDPKLSDGYLIRDNVYNFIGDLAGRERAIQDAYRVDPNNPEVQNTYGYYLLRKFDKRGAAMILNSIQSQYQTQDAQLYTEMAGPYYYMEDWPMVIELEKKAISLNPNSAYTRWDLASMYMHLERYRDALATLADANQMNPYIIDVSGHTYYRMGEYQKAAAAFEKYKEIEKTFEDSTQSIPYRHRLAMTYVKLGRKKEADRLIAEHEKILYEMITHKRSKGTWTTIAGIYYDYALCLAYENKKQQAIANLDSAYKYGWRVHWWYHDDPLLQNLKNEPGYQAVVRKVDEFNDFRKVAFTEAVNLAKVNQELKQKR